MFNSKRNPTISFLSKEIVIKFINRYWVLKTLYELRNNLIRFLFIKPTRSKIYNYFMSSREYSRFINAKKLNKKYCFVYDNSVSSPGLADFLYFLYSIRSLIDKKKLTEVVITKSGFLHSGWDSLISNQKVDYYYNQQYLLFKKLLKDYNVKLSIINSKDIHSFLNQKNKDYIFFSSLISSHKRIYHRLFNFINIVHKKTKSSKFLINKSEYNTEFPSNLSPQNYLTIGFRYSDLWGIDRNHTSNQINKIINHIRLFSKLNIVILSDDIGTAKCKEYLINNKHISSLSFSKDFSSSLLEDASILINSRSYFQFRGGGLGSFALFSEVPYLICAGVCHEKKYSKYNICSWAKHDQLYLKSEEIDFFIKAISDNKDILFS